MQCDLGSYKGSLYFMSTKAMVRKNNEKSQESSNGGIWLINGILKHIVQFMNNDIIYVTSSHTCQHTLAETVACWSWSSFGVGLVRIIFENNVSAWIWVTNTKKIDKKKFFKYNTALIAICRHHIFCFG